MIGIEWIAGVLVFAAICGAYALGRGDNRLTSSSRGLHQIGQYVPPVDVVLEYKNEAGIKTSQRVAVSRSLRHRDGRLYLLAFPGTRKKPRTFRVDRIISVATVDGEVIDIRRFLFDCLAIPPKLYKIRKA